MNKSDKGAAFRGEQRLYQIVARRIAGMIEEHRDLPEWRMPTERDLAEKLKVSRPVIREAIIALEVTGQVAVKGRAGIVVLPRTSAASADFHPQAVPSGSLNDLLGARQALEPGLASLAAQCSAGSTANKLTHRLTAPAAGDSARFADALRGFHLELAQQTGNSVLLTMAQTLHDAWTSAARPIEDELYGAELRPLWIGDFHAIAAAIEAGQSTTAHRAMARHIDNLRAEMNQILQGRTSDEPVAGATSTSSGPAHPKRDKVTAGDGV
ncbi:FadR/GntR family transcriptional regulator [Roseibium salinum]|uniref:FCD domain-containing protein n=1 Tax=Roseibium salinum TaxID=1604349 RepID=A0ABT3QWW9_9HYPH|nr:FCD domain-containing protein [Roseibium sp. DSM 29163]MCX2721331.1 FCD domain-containing protein [Roseibium sp. DSM 29163]